MKVVKVITDTGLEISPATAPNEAQQPRLSAKGIEAVARVIGFARPDCKLCLGRGRAGWDGKFKDRAHVICCACVEFFDLEVVKAAHNAVNSSNGETK